MKKLLTFVLAAGLSAAAFAGNPGFYVQGDLGHSAVTAKYEGEKLKAKGFSPRISAGYDMGGGARVAVDYTHYKSEKDNYNTNVPGVGNVHVENKLSTNSVGVSGIYDFDTGTAVKPYVGARVGVNRVTLEENASVAGFSRKESSHQTKVGLGAMVGASYDITDNVALDAGYRYNHLGKFDGVKVHSNEFHGGVRVKF